MIIFSLGMFIGGVIGFFIAAILSNSKELEIY